MKLHNKKADEKILSIYLFVIYIFVTLGIVAGVLLFNGPNDVRGYESVILSDKIIDCITDQGEIKLNALEKNFNLLTECKFDFTDNTQKYNGEEQYSARIKIYNFKTNELKNTIEAGRIDFLNCLEGKKQPVCFTQELYVINGPNQYLLEILTATGKVGKNTK